MMPLLPSFSAVVEWENARQAGAKRAIRMLRELFSQVGDLAGQLGKPPELIILYERGVVAPDTVEAALRQAGASEARLDVRLHATEGSSYYDQKNVGAELALRDYVLFLDSDVVPEPGWLRALLGSLRNGIEVVAGSTYVDTTSFFGRAFALFWFFPVRSPSLGLKQVGFFYANNVLFRRQLFLAHKFPDMPLYRGQCAALGARLLRRGVGLYLQTNARVSHPPPSPRYFAHRALCEGHDLIAYGRMFGQPERLGFQEFVRHIRAVRERINVRLNRVKVGRREAAAARILGDAYCLLHFVGRHWAARSPEQARRILGIRSSRLPPRS